MKNKTMYCKGGTTMVTVRQVGEAVAGAIEKNVGGKSYPIGWYNLTWTEMLRIFHKYMGCPDKPISIVPTFLYALGMKQVAKQQKAAGIEGGLDMTKFTNVMTAEAFIDKSLGCEPLGVTDDDIDAAIGESVKLSLKIIAGKVDALGMKGE